MDVEYLESELLLLKHELHQLKLGYKNLELENHDLRLENANLQKTNADLQKQLTTLHDKLNINSTNSGLPTSKEIYKIERNTRPKSELKPGGQPGQKPRGYEFKTPDQIIKVVPEEKVCDCGGKLVLSEDYKAHQKIEIPPIKPFITEYRLHSACCAVCAKKYSTSLEDYKILGKNAEGIITALGGFFNNSKREIQAILSQIFNLDISLGLISKSEARVSKKLESKYDGLLQQAQSSGYLHLDETSANNKGKQGWCWIAGNKEVTVFKLTNSRGKKVIESFLPSYEGKVISDRYAVYNIFDEAKRQVCLAHLRRDFKRFAHSRHKSLAIVGKNLLEIINEVFALHRSRRQQQIGELYYLRRVRKGQKKMLYYLKAVERLKECEQAHRVARNLLKCFDMMWHFVKDTEIEPTNNFAERQIKHHVKYRKNSLFTWSQRGDRFLERVKSIFATAKLQKLNPYAQLHALL